MQTQAMLARHSLYMLENICWREILQSELYASFGREFEKENSERSREKSQHDRS
jgi:hypothetical protein